MTINQSIISKLNSFSIKTNSIRLIKDSLNSEIYSIIYRNKIAILKIYKSNDFLRIEREVKVLKLLNKKNFKNIPKLYEFSVENKFIIMSFVKGEVPNADRFFIKKLALYINNMQLYVNSQDKKKLPNAAEASFSLFEHFQIVINKFEYIKSKFKDLEPAHNTLEIIETKILPWIYKYENKIKKNNSYFNEIISTNELILSQSDIGVHNSFIYKEQINTFDYEYAGLDDPSKTFCDLLINPNIILKPDTLVLIFNDLKDLKIFKSCFQKTLIILPLYRYKWYSIILNSFLKTNKFNSIKSLIFLKKANNYLRNTYKPIKFLLDDIYLEI